MTVWVAVNAQGPELNIIELGTFIVLSATLVAIMVYAYDTNTMARIDREQWKRASVLNTTYTMGVVGDRRNDGHTTFAIQNPSTLIVRAKVRLNPQIYGESVRHGHPGLNGEQTWYIFPQQISQGWFTIASLLTAKNKIIDQMIHERTNQNCATQLTIDLEIEFRDELNNSRTLPCRRHYFDFKEWRWIPVIIQKDDWD